MNYHVLTFSLALIRKLELLCWWKKSTLEKEISKYYLNKVVCKLEFFSTIYFQIDFVRTSNWPFKSKYILALYVTTSLHAFLLSFEKPQCKERKAIFCDYLKLDCPTICFHKTESYTCFDPTTYYNSFYGQSFYFSLRCRNKLSYCLSKYDVLF